jgi:hypothetical protein
MTSLYPSASGREQLRVSEGVSVHLTRGLGQVEDHSPALGALTSRAIAFGGFCRIRLEPIASPGAWGAFTLRAGGCFRSW